MTNNNSQLIATELNLRLNQVEATLSLLAEGGTVPFIARYRKEATGTLDEVAITAIRDRSQQLEELDKRREAIRKSLKERDLLTAEIDKLIENSRNLNELEDIYLPYKPKRKTRASAAREKGLEPLALMILEYKCKDPKLEAQNFINAEKGVNTEDEALSGARDIIAELINEDASLRKQSRNLWTKRSTIRSKSVAAKESEGAKFKDYFDWEEQASSAPSHRILAIFRGESEGVLRVSVMVESEEALQIMRQRFLKQKGPVSDQIELAIQDTFKRLLAPSMETEMRALLKERADLEAIRVFASNLRELLMAPPLGQKRVLAIDPGLRTGCKIVSLTETGKLEHHDVLPLALNPGADAERRFLALCDKYKIEAIAIGNGTGSRETEQFVRALKTSGKLKDVAIVLVNESGASIYSASEVARAEFPNEDITVRGAVSIGRRLIDPLAELVKIDAKSIGVGQYQHDVDQSELKKSLDDVVVSCVNTVGVEMNTASKQLLSYVSGLGPQLAEGIVKYRDENGPFKGRDELKKVPRLGPKAFEQCAGFLRVRGAKNPLDTTAVHPESYKIVESMAKDCGAHVADLIAKPELRRRIDLKKYVTDKVGLPTLNDILAELDKPGRDPRSALEPMEFADGITKPEDLKPGMKLPGIVTNVTAFGAFVDVGVHQDGLVHISQLADKFVKDPNEVVKVGQRVNVTVMQVELDRNRISLTMKSR